MSQVVTLCDERYLNRDVWPSVHVESALTLTTVFEREELSKPLITFTTISPRA